LKTTELVSLNVRPSSVIGPTEPVMAITPANETLKGLLPVIVPLDQFDAPRIETLPVPLILPVDLPPPAKLSAPLALFVTVLLSLSTKARIDEPDAPALFVICPVPPLTRSVPAPEGTAWMSKSPAIVNEPPILSSFAVAPLMVSRFVITVGEYVIAPLLLMTPVRIIPELLPSIDDVLETLSGPVPPIVPRSHLMPPVALMEALKVWVPLTNLTGAVPLNDVPLLKVLLPPKAIEVVLPEMNDPLCVPLPARPMAALPALTVPLLFSGALMALLVPPVLASVPCC
jgi:hypothetical protein